jgi:hypothetical protein
MVRKTGRIFKTALFAKSARKGGIADAVLCKAIQRVMQGQADDLGGGVFKKRLNENRHRAIILATGGSHWFYQYLFAKKDRDNIDDDELEAFRKLAKTYGKATDSQLERMLENKDLVEICNDGEAQIQK